MPTQGRNETSEESNETSEEMFLAYVKIKNSHVENVKSPRGYRVL